MRPCTLQGGWHFSPETGQALLFWSLTFILAVCTWPFQSGGEGHQVLTQERDLHLTLKRGGTLTAVMKTSQWHISFLVTEGKPEACSRPDLLKNRLKNTSAPMTLRSDPRPTRGLLSPRWAPLTSTKFIKGERTENL